MERHLKAKAAHAIHLGFMIVNDEIKMERDAERSATARRTASSATGAESFGELDHFGRS